MEFIFKHFGKFWIGSAILTLLLSSTVVYVIAHFIRKHW